MSYRRDVERSIIRGLGYRITRGLPFWVALVALAIIWLVGADINP